jgi:hypothetical protein
MAAFYTGSYTQASLSGGSFYYELLGSGTLTLDDTNGYGAGAIMQAILLVGGGGGSGNDGGGGGGGVAFASSINRVLNAGSYSVSIGAGGSVGIFSANRGGDTTAFGYTAVGSPSARFNAANNDGANGSGTVDSTVCSSYGNAPTGQPTISGFQTWGGNAGGSHGCGRGSGSGGGATAVGAGTEQPGGNGIQISIGNTNRWYATGGRSSYLGGGTNNTNWRGVANSGDGGTSNTSGYSGVVILVLLPQTVTVNVNANILVIGGGGAGGCFSGGGAGGAVYATNQALTSSSSYNVTVGAGGTFPTVGSQLDSGGTTLVYNVEGVGGNSGGASSFSTTIRAGGGNGGGTNSNQGGATGSAITVPSGASTFANPSSPGTSGANGTGGTGSDFQGGGGSSVVINGVTYSFGGGGSGCGYWNVSGSSPGGRTAGGVTGGGRSGLIAGNRSSGVQPSAGDPPVPNTTSYSPGEAGSPNTGGGGGAAARAEVVFSFGNWGVLGGNGGSGRVVITYQNTNVLFSGGTVSSSGSGASTIWRHDFTSPGSFSFSGLSGTYSGFGGNGGALGQVGNNGGTSSSGQTGGTGGASGYGLLKNGYNVTVINSGSFLGGSV